MTNTPKKTITLTRKPASSDTATPPAGTVSRSGKRIIRREELPNVQRPGKGGKPPANKAKPKKPPRKPQPKKQVTPPSELKMRELNDRLNAFMVWLQYKPLAVGIEKEIFRLVNEEHFPGASKKVVQKLLRMHTNHGLYLQAIQQGTVRYSLDGTEAGEITAYQQQFAADILQKRLQQKA